VLSMKTFATCSHVWQMVAAPLALSRASRGGCGVWPQQLLLRAAPCPSSGLAVGRPAPEGAWSGSLELFTLLVFWGAEDLRFETSKQFIVGAGSFLRDASFEH